MGLVTALKSPEADGLPSDQLRQDRTLSKVELAW